MSSTSWHVPSACSGCVKPTTSCNCRCARVRLARSRRWVVPRSFAVLRSSKDSRDHLQLEHRTTVLILSQTRLNDGSCHSRARSKGQEQVQDQERASAVHRVPACRQSPPCTVCFSCWLQGEKTTVEKWDWNNCINTARVPATGRDDPDRVVVGVSHDRHVVGHRRHAVREVEG